MTTTKLTMSAAASPKALTPTCVTSSTLSLSSGGGGGGGGSGKNSGTSSIRSSIRNVHEQVRI